MNTITKYISKDGKIKMEAGFSGWYQLSYNGIEIGNSYTEKNFTNPEAWAKRQVAKRLKVIERNLERLHDELENWENEYEELKK